ncbi:hypothetical protein CR513_46556, partial [Mucuna pruriens]
MTSMITYLNHGIFHQSSCNHTPQQNGITENKKNWHILELIQSIMFTSNVPNHFGGEAVLMATYPILRMGGCNFDGFPTLINCLPYKPLQFLTPLNCFEKAFQLVKNLKSLPPKIFGCTVFTQTLVVHRENLILGTINAYFLVILPR